MSSWRAQGKFYCINNLRLDILHTRENKSCWYLKTFIIKAVFFDSFKLQYKQDRITRSRVESGMQNFSCYVWRLQDTWQACLWSGGHYRTVCNERCMKVNKRMHKVAQNMVHGQALVKALMSLSLEALTAVLLDIQFFWDSRHVDRQIVTNRHAATSQKTSIVMKQWHISTHIYVIYKFIAILKLILIKVM